MTRVMSVGWSVPRTVTHLAWRVFFVDAVVLRTHFNVVFAQPSFLVVTQSACRRHAFGSCSPSIEHRTLSFEKFPIFVPSIAPICSGNRSLCSHCSNPFNVFFKCTGRSSTHFASLSQPQWREKWPEIKFSETQLHGFKGCRQFVNRHLRPCTWREDITHFLQDRILLRRPGISEFLRKHRVSHLVRVFISNPCTTKRRRRQPRTHEFDSHF